MNNEIIDEPTIEDSPLASRLSRLAAQIIDSLILAPISAFVMVYYLNITAFMESDDPGELMAYMASLDIFDVVMVTLPPALGYVVINYFTLEKYGQSLGKRLCGIRIVTLTNHIPPVRKLIFDRFLLIQAIGVVPGIGGIFSILNVLFIFGSEKRCIHDVIAQTKVVKA